MTRWAGSLCILLGWTTAYAQSYSYDAAGRLTRVVYKAGGGIAYRYDDADNLLASLVLQVPPAPGEVSAARQTETTARVTWPFTSGANGYIIERREEGGTQWQQIATVGSAATSFIDTTLEPGKRYAYRVAAVGPDGASAYSKEATFGGIGRPTISSTGILNGASFQPRLAPGGVVSIFGGNLGQRMNAAGAIESVTAVAGPPPLPLSLAGYSVEIDGVRAPLFFVGPGQINAQAPWSTRSGQRQIMVRHEVNGEVLASDPVTVDIAAVGPALFTFDPGGVGKAVAVNVSVSPDDGVVTGSVAQPPESIPSVPSQPAPRGGVVILYATGLGAVEPPVQDGADSTDQVRRITNEVEVTIGGARAQILFSGLSPAYPGVNQLNVLVPLGAVPGDAAPIRIDQGGVASQSGVTIAVR